MASCWENLHLGKITLYTVETIILPCVSKKHEEHGQPNQTALVIFDEFKAQVTDDVFSMLDSNSIQVVKIPPNCTDRLQPVDLSINKPVKDLLQNKFQKWYTEEVKRAMVNQEVLCLLI